MDDYIGVDLGKKPETSEVMEAPKAEEKVYYPSFYVHDVKLPEIPEGDFYAKVKLCKRRYSKEYGNDGSVTGSSCEFDVKEMKIPAMEKEMRDDSGKALEVAIVQMEQGNSEEY